MPSAGTREFEDDDGCRTLPYGTFQGKTGSGVDSFLGVPFALPPSGTNRLTAPQPPKTYDGVQNATKYGPSCPGQLLTGNLLGGLPTAIIDQVLALPIFQSSSDTSEGGCYRYALQICQFLILQR